VSKAQRGVVLIAGAALALMLAVPPWETYGGHYLGHAPITSPPGFSAPRADTHAWAFPGPDPIARVSLSLLAAQLAALWIVAGAAFLLLARRRKHDEGRGS
jgi:hypothetical protein